MHSINDWNKPNVFSETKSFGIIVLKKTALNKFAVREKGNCKKTCETYWAYYGKYAGPSIQNTDPICKVYITENIYGHHPYILWVIEKSNMKRFSAKFYFSSSVFSHPIKARNVGEYFPPKKLSFGKIYEGI